MIKLKDTMSEKAEVRRYLKPASSFHTLDEWEEMAYYLLDLQGQGIDSRGGQLSCKHPTTCSTQDFNNFLGLISKYFKYQLTDEVDRWDLLTKKNVMDFIEDFVNHRLWAFDKEYGHYFPDIRKLRFAFFYSRGDLEPYVMLDDEYTIQLYGSVYNPKLLCHYTTPRGARRIADAIASGEDFDISSFTVIERPFFREASTVLLTFVGNVRAGFRSDIKSVALDNGRRACNMHRIEYPGHEINNICYELDTCDGGIKTSLWNEYIATPIQIVDAVER